MAERSKSMYVSGGAAMIAAALIICTLAICITLFISKPKELTLQQQYKIACLEGGRTYSPDGTCEKD